MSRRSLASIVLWIGASVCLCLCLLVLDGRGSRAVALLGYVVLQAASIFAREKSERERPGLWWLVLAACSAAVLLGFWVAGY
jgi:hypothetical protein